MIESGYYPPGAEFDPNAPYNQKELPEKEIEVTVSITLSKTVKIKISDYTIYSNEDERGRCFDTLDYSDCDLKKAVKDQIILPQNAYNYIISKSNKEIQAISDLKEWNVDEMEVMLE